MRPALSPPRVAVYCGSRAGVRATYAQAARAFGRGLAERGLGLVYGGGSVGLMGVVADAVLEAGGEAIGVIPGFLATSEIAHDALTELEVVDGMQPRKLRMVELAGAFVALPGGTGTMEELFEVLSWRQLELHTKPVGLLNVDGFYTPLVAGINHLRDEGFVSPEQRALLHVESDPQALLEALLAASGEGSDASS